MWTDLKATAMADGYKATSAYTDLSAEDKAIVCALIAAQDATGNVSAALESTSAVTVEWFEAEEESVEEESAADETVEEEEVVEVGATHTLSFIFDNDNFIGGLSWADWKTDENAMEFGLSLNPAYTELSNMAKALIDSHRDAQLVDDTTECYGINDDEWAGEICDE